MTLFRTEKRDNLEALHKEENRTYAVCGQEILAVWAKVLPSCDRAQARV